MANTLNIEERTLAQISESTNSINVLGTGAGNRLEALKSHICRITDHADDSGGTGDDVENMAIFESRAHGHPWIKDRNTLSKVTVVAAADPVGTPTATNVTTLYPNHDYADFQ